LLSVDRLLLHGGRGPHTRRTDADAAKQRTLVYLNYRGRGNRCFCRLELITIVTPSSGPSSAKTAASVGLYSVYRKQERSLFTAALEQTSNVPPARNVGRSSGRVRWWAYGLPYPASGRRSHPCRAACLLLDRCATAPETRPLPAVSLAHPARDVNRLSLSSDVRQGEAVIPGPSSGGRWPLRFPGRAPPYHPPAVLGAPLPAMLIVRRRWGPVIGRERRRVRPVIARPPRRRSTDSTQVKVRTRAKSRVSIETRELRLSSRECDFPGINMPIFEET